MVNVKILLNVPVIKASVIAGTAEEELEKRLRVRKKVFHIMMHLADTAGVTVLSN